MKYSVIIIFLLNSQSHECGKAATKCTEYGKAVFVKTQSPVLARRAKQLSVSECGIVSVPLIVGGSEASSKEFPHMALIGFGDFPDSELSWQCGGSLISDLYILTAAHCLESRELGPAQKVRLGTIRVQTLGPDLQERTIKTRIAHPLYKPPNKANDIALLKLDSSVHFTPYVRPACLHSQEIGAGRKALASGFGKLSFDAETGSSNLMKVLLEVYDNKECSKALNLREIGENMLCAGQMSGGKDTCQGDSGGPLQIVLDDPYCMYSIVGVTSFGKFCGFANSPAIYTRVSKYVPWIENIVWN